MRIKQRCPKHGVQLFTDFNYCPCCSAYETGLRESRPRDPKKIRIGELLMLTGIVEIESIKLHVDMPGEDFIKALRAVEKYQEDSTRCPQCRIRTVTAHTTNALGYLICSYCYKENMLADVKPICDPWVPVILGGPDQTEDSGFEISVVRLSNEHGRQSWGWFDKDKLLISANGNCSFHMSQEVWAGLIMFANATAERLNEEERKQGAK